MEAVSVRELLAADGHRGAAEGKGSWGDSAPGEGASGSPTREDRRRGKFWKGGLGVGGDFRFTEKSRKYVSSAPFTPYLSRYVYYNE